MTKSGVLSQNLQMISIGIACDYDIFLDNMRSVDVNNDESKVRHPRGRPPKKRRHSTGTHHVNLETLNLEVDAKNQTSQSFVSEISTQTILCLSDEMLLLTEEAIKGPRKVDACTQTGDELDSTAFSDPNIVKRTLLHISNKSGNFRVCKSNGQSEMLFTSALLRASSIIDEGVTMGRSQTVAIKEMTAVFGPDVIDDDMLRSENSIRTAMQQLVLLIKTRLIAKMKAEVPACVFCISMDESNKKGDDKMLIMLSYATDTCRIVYICIGAVSCTSKKANESYTHTIAKAILEFDPSGDVLRWLRLCGHAMVDHCPSAMKLARLTARYPYDCDSHGADLVYSKMSETVVGTQDGLGSLRIFQFLYELGYTRRNERKIWDYVMENAYGNMSNAPKPVRNTIRLINSARWGSAGIVAREYLILAGIRAPYRLIQFICQKYPHITQQELLDIKTVSGMIMLFCMPAVYHVYLI